MLTLGKVIQNSPWPVCAWAHSSWHNLGSRTPWQSLLSCHHRTESWSQRRRRHQGWSCTSWRASPWFQSLGLWPCRDGGHRRPTERKGQAINVSCFRTGALARDVINWEHVSPYHLLPLKQSVRHELAGPDCYSVVLKTEGNYALATRKLLYL